MKRFVWLYFLVAGAAVFAQPADTMWTRQIGLAPDEMITATCPYGDGGFVLAGYCGFNGDEIGPQNFFVARANAEGFPLWMTELGLADTNEFAYAVTATANGDIVIAGDDYNYSPLYHSAHIVRLDSQGNVVWDHTFGDRLATKNFCAVAELANGDLVAAGTQLSDDVNYDVYLVRMNAGGDTLWTRTFGDATIERVTDMTIMPNGDFLLCGNKWDDEQDFNLVLLIRADADGNLVWMNTYWSGIQVLNFTGQDVTVMPNGDIGVSATCHDDLMRIWLMHATADGDSLWTRTYSFDEYTTESCDVIGTWDNQLAVIAMAGSSPAYHIVLMKAAENGDLAWEFHYAPDQYSMMVTGLLQTADHGFVISGSCINFSNQSDGLLLKTAPEGTDASNAFDPRPASFTLSAFPNPFNPATTISFSLPQTQAVKLVVYDVSGREVRVLSNGRYEAGEHHITFDGTELPSGIYFAHLESKDQARTTKLMLLK